MGQEEPEQNSPAIDFESDSQRFLTADRLAEIGGLIAPMVGAGSSWIERRKESVQLLDDTALRRQISVDFSLRRSVAPLLDETESGRDPLYCAPIFVLPKSPANFRSFDLCDEDHHSLFLIAREDNARISAEVLIALVKDRAGLSAKEEFARRAGARTSPPGGVGGGQGRTHRQAPGRPRWALAAGARRDAR